MLALQVGDADDPHRGGGGVEGLPAGAALAPCPGHRPDQLGAAVSAEVVLPVPHEERPALAESVGRATVHHEEAHSEVRELAESLGLHLVRVGLFGEQGGKPGSAVLLHSQDDALLRQVGGQSVRLRVAEEGR